MVHSSYANNPWKIKQDLPPCLIELVIAKQES